MHLHEQELAKRISQVRDQALDLVLLGQLEPLSTSRAIIKLRIGFGKLMKGKAPSKGRWQDWFSLHCASKGLSKGVPAVEGLGKFKACRLQRLLTETKLFWALRRLHHAPQAHREKQAHVSPEVPRKPWWQSSFPPRWVVQ